MMFQLQKKPLILMGLAAAAGLAYYLHSKSASAASSLAGITGGTIGGDTASTVSGWSNPGTVYVSVPATAVPDPVANTPVSVPTKPATIATGPAATTGPVFGAASSGPPAPAVPLNDGSNPDDPGRNTAAQQTATNNALALGMW